MPPLISTGASSGSPSSQNTQRLLTILTALGSLLILGWLLKYSAYGFDFTDESFYLIWMHNPFIYPASVSQFGFIYHPLYRLLDGDIAALRQANILITYSLAWALCYLYLTSLNPDANQRTRTNQPTLIAISAALAISALTSVDYGFLATPSYNGLALQALLISAIGLILTDPTANRKSLAGWLLVGIGGWLAFMAKPSTAVGLAAGALLYLFLARKVSIRMLALTLATALALLLISAFLIDASIPRFVERYQLGLEMGKQLGGGHTLSNIFRIDTFTLDKRTTAAFALILGLVMLALSGIGSNHRQWQRLGLAISLGFFLITLSLALGWIEHAAGFARFQDLLIFALTFAALGAGLLLGRQKALAACRTWIVESENRPQRAQFLPDLQPNSPAIRQKYGEKCAAAVDLQPTTSKSDRLLASIPAQHWALAALFLIMPHLYALGTGNNYWHQAGSAAIFWLLAGLVMLRPGIRQPASWLLLLPLALATQAVTATLLQTGQVNPYRQPQPLKLNTSPARLGPQQSKLMLSQGYAKYIETAVTSAHAAGLLPNTPMIDLTGQSPGILFALGATSIGQVWTPGGYPGSLAFAKAGLDRFTCNEIANAWILLEPEGPLSIAATAIQDSGTSFPQGYQKTATWQTAPGAGGYPTPRTQELYRPMESQESLARCQALRVPESP